ncbi:hypothetical protein DFJ73DRAFT_75451 [Zopfochytrium polystomum]|nr:hypothetical protein DFJ73DRAFT_75451 [Zopfochytrium polystomum]
MVFLTLSLSAAALLLSSKVAAAPMNEAVVDVGSVSFPQLETELSRRSLWYNSYSPRSCYSSWKDPTGIFNVLCQTGTDLAATKTDLAAQGITCWTEALYTGQLRCSKSLPSYLPYGDPLSCYSASKDYTNFKVSCAVAKDVSALQQSLKAGGTSCSATSSGGLSCKLPQPAYIPSADPRTCVSDDSDDETYGVRCGSAGDQSTVRGYLVGAGYSCQLPLAGKLLFRCKHSRPRWIPASGPSALSCYSDWNDASAFNVRCDSAGDLPAVQKTLVASANGTCYSGYDTTQFWCLTPRPTWLPDYSCP